MELINIESEVAKKCGLCYEFSSIANKNHVNEYNLIFSYNLALLNYEKGMNIFDHPKEYFNILKLLIIGEINVEGSKFSFSELLTNEDKITKSIYILSCAILITLNYIETNNFYKSVKIEKLNSDYILESVKVIDEFDEKMNVEPMVFSLLKDKSNELLRIIMNSGNMIN